MRHKPEEHQKCFWAGAHNTAAATGEDSDIGGGAQL